MVKNERNMNFKLGKGGIYIVILMTVIYFFLSFIPPWGRVTYSGNGGPC